MLNIFNIKDDVTAIDFCKQFSNSKPQNRCVFGRNEYAKSIAEVIDVSCFVDDFTEEKEYLGKPIIKTKNIPVDSLVVVAVALGRPLTVEKMLNNLGIKHISYFAFHKYSGLSVLPVTFWDSFEPDFSSHKDKYERVFDLLADDESKRILEKIINFRLSADLKYMDGFTDRQQEQYFEVFLDLDKKGEVFVDVGGFDGFTSLEFMKRCPEYEALYFLEPEKKNMDIAKSRLKNFKNIHYLDKGLSNKKDVVRFSIGGSSSAMSKDGEVEINVDALDNIVNDKVSFIKMDIEGAESLAIEGANETILKYHPRLAICVYHKADDIWSIPEQVFSIRDDYHIYLRHYTEGVTETVMFFMPKK